MTTPALPGFMGTFSEGEPLSQHTYYRIGGPADYFAVPKSMADLRCLREFLSTQKMPYFVMGAGSNLLVSDLGFRGLIIKLSRMNIAISVEPSEAGERIRCGAGVTVSTLLRKAAHEGWDGFAWMSGIPGSIGGVIAMNAGTHLGEAKDNVRSAEIFHLQGTREVETVEGEALRFEYRKNYFLTPDALITEATFALKPGNSVEVKARIDETLRRRKETQPLEFPSCGSVFKNPRESGMRAWEVIDSLRLRGRQIGAAQISEKHPNFIVNLGDAKASDVRALIELVQAEARAQLGIEMHEEVKFIGQI